MPGDLRPEGAARASPPSPSVARRSDTGWSPLVSVLVAIGVGLVAAVGWSILRGILELSVGLLVVSAMGGWGVGAALRRGMPSTPLALALGIGAWVVSLLLTWIVTRVTLLSDRDLAGRLAQTPFLDFTAQQFGLLELVSLLLFTGGAAYGVRRPAARS
jgi:hypothetical protein